MSKPRRYTFIAALVVVALIAAYYVSSLYIEAQAKYTLNQLITRIKTQYANNISDITYHSIDISPLSLITNRYQINDVVITPKDPLYQINVAHILIHNYALDHDDAPGPFTIQLDNISAPQLLKHLKSLTGVEMFSPLVNSVTQHSQLNAQVQYQNTTKRMQIHVILKHRRETWAYYDLTLANFALTPATDSLTAPNVLPSILNQAYILSVNSDVNIHLAPTAKHLAATLPTLADSLNALGYHTFDLSVVGNSHYSAATQTTLTNMQVILKNGGTLTLYSKQLQPHVITLDALIAALLNQTLPPDQQTQIPLLVELKMQYHDQGLFNRVMALYANQINQSPFQLQLEIGTALMVIPTVNQIPPLRQAAVQISRFIQIPGTLTIEIKPAQPLRIDQVLVNYQHAMTQAPYAFSNAELSADQKRRQTKAIQNQLSTELLNTLGFTVTSS